MGFLEGGVRLVDALRLRAAMRHGQGWDSLVPLGADLMMGLLWMAAIGALALGLAIGFAGLVIGNRATRGVVYAVLTVAGVVAQVIFVELTAATSWNFGGFDRVDADVLAAIGLTAVPVVPVRRDLGVPGAGGQNAEIDFGARCGRVRVRTTAS